MNTWYIAAGISTLLGIAGTVVYSMYKNQDKFLDIDNIAPEILDRLLAVNVTPAILREIPPEDRLKFLKNHSGISREVIEKILSAGNRRKAKYSLVFLILMFLLALTSIAISVMEGNPKAAGETEVAADTTDTDYNGCTCTNHPYPTDDSDLPLNFLMIFGLNSYFDKITIISSRL